MLKWQGLGLLLAVAFASAANVAWAQGATRLTGQYVGELKLLKTVRGDCTEPPPGAVYPMTISGGQVQFKYDPRFDTVLRGQIAENGSFHASQRLPKGRISMSGYIQGNTVTARLKSPSCRYTFRTSN